MRLRRLFPVLLGTIPGVVAGVQFLDTGADPQIARAAAGSALIVAAFLMLAAPKLSVGPQHVAAGIAAGFLGGLMGGIGLKVQDMNAAVAELRRKGAEFVVEPNSPRPGVKLAFMQAPDGVRIEILQRDTP